MHVHGMHSAAMDGVSGIGHGEIAPGETFVYDMPALTWTTFGGVIAGITVMYLTALLVAA